jgi:hypothetical protein
MDYNAHVPIGGHVQADWILQVGQEREGAADDSLLAPGSGNDSVGFHAYCANSRLFGGLFAAYCAKLARRNPPLSSAYFVGMAEKRK